MLNKDFWFSKGNKLLTANCNDIFHSTYKYFFDLTDAELIKSAILGDWYVNWYTDNLKILQKKVFGDYCLAGCAEKTAELILKLAANGTLGEECDSVYFKDKFFYQPNKQ